MNSSAIWEIIALSHAFEGNVIARGEVECNLPFHNAARITYQLLACTFYKLHAELQYSRLGINALIVVR